MAIKKGDKAPDFKGKNTEGSTVTLADFVGRKVALYFYPKDDTPGCTAQACSIRDNYNELLGRGLSILGISADSEQSHEKFITKYSLPFPLIADVDHSIAEAYGVWIEKNNYGKKYMGIARTTFIVDEQGMVDAVISKVDTKNAADQMLNLI